ncbi:MAG: sulfatase-like hydrolase/transferase, partial [bacterium]|nr:sulfatase-like hydrolase/transferase [bacterium]
AAAVAAPDVVFLSVDTLRADRLGCYGYELDTSPNLDAFAEEALVFEDCVCEVPLTSPSFGSMLSSRFPRMTGTMRNGLRMPRDVPLVAEAFREGGYQTFCVQSNWTLKADISGLDRGFDVYRDDFNKKRWGFFIPERYADDVTDIALKLLRRRDKDRPLFCWIHYSDPHEPYRFHKKYNPSNRNLKGLDKFTETRVSYDSEVAFTDHHIGRLLKAIPMEETVVLFVADHGESLHEHDYVGHGRKLYQPGLHIPLMIRAPGVDPGRSRAPARGIDIGPTLLALGDLSRMSGMLGTNLIGGAIPAERPRVIETYGGAVPRIPGAGAIMNDIPPMFQGVLLENWKLIVDGKKSELYDLDADPDELANVSDDHGERVTKLRTIVEAWDSITERRKSDEAELTDDDLEALESLGYVD